MALTLPNFFSGVNTSSHFVSESGGNLGQIWQDKTSGSDENLQVVQGLRWCSWSLKWSIFGACGGMTRAKMSLASLAAP